MKARVPDICYIKVQLQPFFGDLNFADTKNVTVKRFVAQLLNKKTKYGKKLSAKTINNYMVPCGR
ncbi:MAG: hypothetical protein JRI53_04220 [Deltaproteobacteria bacterium]|nr:hypothetical protein [Deltaproteobacteria bacterium]MBW1983902.1 hypothetical protein [Deltaproteobacteria bacterium]